MPTPLRKAAVAALVAALLVAGSAHAAALASNEPVAKAQNVGITATTINHNSRVVLDFEPDLTDGKNYTFRIRKVDGAYLPGTFRTRGEHETATLKPLKAGSYEAIYTSADGVTWSSAPFRIEKNPVPVKFRVTGCPKGEISWRGVGFNGYPEAGTTLNRTGYGTLWLTPGMKVKFLLKCPKTQIASYVVVKYKGAGARITEKEAARATAAALAWKVRKATVRVRVTNLGTVSIKGTEGGTYQLKAARAYTPKAYKAYAYQSIPLSAKGRVSPPIE